MHLSLPRGEAPAMRHFCSNKDGFEGGGLLEVRMQKRKSLGSSFSELLTRLELVTSSLPRKCSTTELQQHSSLRVVQKYIRILKRPNKNAFFRDKFLERAARQAFPDGAERLEGGRGAASSRHRAFGAADGAQAVLGRGGALPCGAGRTRRAGIFSVCVKKLRKKCRFSYSFANFTSKP